MITAEGIIGKLVLFIVNKTVGKLIELPFDKRRKACRTLTKLYYCIQALDDITEDFLQTLKRFQESGDGDASAVVHSLNNHKYDLELATNMFLNLGHELDDGLEIIDPALAKCCHALYVGKYDFLTFISESVKWDRTTDAAKMVVKKPTGKMEGVDLDALYKETKLALDEGVVHYWPSSALDDFSDDFQDFTLTFEDESAATQLKDMIIKQNQTLKQAKEKLRNLIKDNFSIEEVLFQSDSHPYR